MKKLFFALLALVVLVGCAASNADEETTLRSGDFEYAVMENGDAELIRYRGEEGLVIIPNALDGHPVTSVRGNPFVIVDDWGDYEEIVYMDCTVYVERDHPYLATIDGVLFGMTDRKLIYYQSSLKAASYEIPYGITGIGDWAFAFCSDLTSVTIPDSVTSIGDYAFENCSGLTNVMIPDSVTSIGVEAFAYCNDLSGVTIPDSVTSIGERAFDGLGTSMENLVFTVSPGSYAEAWCRENGRKYVNSGMEYSDRTDWLPGR